MSNGTDKKEARLDACLADFADIKRKLDRLERKLDSLQAKLYGSSARGDIGDIAEIKGWEQSFGNELGMVQARLTKMRKALE